MDSNAFMQQYGASQVTPQSTPQLQGAQGYMAAYGASQQEETTPSDVKNAQQYIGEDVDPGYCETFAEQVTGSPQMGATAYDAFQNYTKQGQARTDYQNMQPGDLLYFAPDPSQNGGNGHVGVYAGGGQMISALYNGVTKSDINTFGQQPIGYVPIGVKQ